MSARTPTRSSLERGDPHRMNNAEDLFGGSPARVRRALPFPIGHERVTPTRTQVRRVPTRQRNQENSEEAAMSVLQEEVSRTRITDENQAQSQNGVLDDTPPREGRFDHFLRRT